jgi:hypothetical protein
LSVLSEADAIHKVCMLLSLFFQPAAPWFFSLWFFSRFGFSLILSFRILLMCLSYLESQNKLVSGSSVNLY